MAANRLRIYLGPTDETPAAEWPGVQEKQEKVTVPLSEVFPALAHAVATRKSWVDDFADDEITLSADLYEVILAYQHFRRGA